MSEKFIIYKALKLLSSFSNFMKEPKDNKKRLRVSVCKRHVLKFKELTKKQAIGLAKKAARDPTHCVFCKKKLAPSHLRKVEKFDFPDDD